jgi:ABC-2 type transport system ATP-binding protein
VRELAATGSAVIYTSHYLTEIEELAATVAVLEEGQIVARGPLQELVSRYGSPALRLSFDGPAPRLPGFEIAGREATLHTAHPAHAAAEILQRLDGQAAHLRSVDIVRPSLEAAYLALTGRRSNDETVNSNREVRDGLVA